MASPRTITIVALSFALGLFFVFMGTIKLTPRLSKDAYSEMVSEAYYCNAALLHMDEEGSVLQMLKVFASTHSGWLRIFRDVSLE